MLKISRDNIGWGVRWGVYVATAFAIIAVPGLSSTSVEDTNGLSAPILIGAYYLFGIVVGLVVGIARPRLHEPRIALLVGILSATIVYGPIFWLHGGPPWKWAPAVYVLFVAVVVLSGSITSFGIRRVRPAQSQSKNNPSNPRRR